MDIPQATGIDRAVLEIRYDEIRSVYLADSRPWVIGYSGGKDSTTALQLIWYALASLPEDQRMKPVYVISSDTLVETPQIVNYIDKALERINHAAPQQQLPFSAHKVSPHSDNTFWINMIGRGYPAPSKRFRWCTDRLKIDPANRFIIDKVAQHGEVVVVLGVRKSESSTRAQVMSLHRIKGSRLARHSSLSRAFVFTPIEDFTTDDVWNYLLQVPAPWGGNNRDLVTLYRNAQAGECPLVVDRTTPSCGNSRFGCWVCTVVTRDKSMEAMIEHGEEWLEPMLDFRDLLVGTQDPAAKAQLREVKRRDGHVKWKTSGGGVVYGPYKLEVRKDLLRRLLEVQKRVRAEGPNPSEELITVAELQVIRRIWRLEEQDWEDSVPKIYRAVIGVDLDWTTDDQATFSGEDRLLLDEICTRHGIPSAKVAKLLDIERTAHGMSRRSSVHQRIAGVFEEEWRSDAEILSSEPPR